MYLNGEELNNDTLIDNDADTCVSIPDTTAATWTRWRNIGKWNNFLLFLKTIFFLIKL